VATAETWPATLEVIGTVAAVQGVTVSADLPGTIDRVTFDSGQAVREGDLLVQLDTRQEQAQLSAVEAARELTRLNFGRMRGLLEERVVSQAEYDRATAEQGQAEARVGEIRAAIERKTIRAPFTGILGIRQVNRGQYLAGGDPIVSLQSLNPIYVNFGVPQQELGSVRFGRPVRVTAGDLGGIEFTGTVTAIDAVVDEATRNVEVQATLANPGGKLRPGMFVQTRVTLGEGRSVIPVPASAISYAPYGDSVFVVDGPKAPAGQASRAVHQQFVKVEGSRGDQVAIVSGINGGEEVVTSGVFKLRNGAAVQINNTTQPGNDPAPKPEDN
jgi:membrane fusion protein, multidrug efflux system